MVIRSTGALPGPTDHVIHLDNRHHRDQSLLHQLRPQPEELRTGGDPRNGADAGVGEQHLEEQEVLDVDRRPIRLIGAVLNDVRSTASEYKYYLYSYGYGATDENEAVGKLPATTT